MEINEKFIAENHISSIFVQSPLWFGAGQDRFYVWNYETKTMLSYEYNDIDIVSKHSETTGCIDSSEQTTYEIVIIMSLGQVFTIKSDEGKNFDEFYMDLLGQLAIHA